MSSISLEVFVHLYQNLSIFLTSNIFNKCENMTTLFLLKFLLHFIKTYRKCIFVQQPENKNAIFSSKLFKTELLWASPRQALNILEAEEVGCDIITITPELLYKTSNFGKMCIFNSFIKVISNFC